jgi:hypothetical protein
MAYNVGEGELRITDGMQDSIGRHTPCQETQAVSRSYQATSLLQFQNRRRHHSPSPPSPLTMPVAPVSEATSNLIPSSQHEPACNESPKAPSLIVMPSALVPSSSDAPLASDAQPAPAAPSILIPEFIPAPKVKKAAKTAQQ